MFPPVFSKSSSPLTVGSSSFISLLNVNIHLGLVLLEGMSDAGAEIVPKGAEVTCLEPDAGNIQGSQGPVHSALWSRSSQSQTLEIEER